MANTGLHPTRLIEGLGRRRTLGRRLIELFTHRPVAKIVSLGLATLLVFLIDSELTDDLFYEPVTVVAEGQGRTRTDLEVHVHPDFSVVLDGSAEKIRVRVRGFRKYKELIPAPLKATIPEGRLLGVAEVPMSVSVEPGDLALPYFGRGAVTFSSALTVQVVRRVRTDRRLDSRDTREVTGGIALRAEFSPPRVRLTGPAHAVRNVPEPIVVPMSAPGSRMLFASDLSLPAGVAIEGGGVQMTVQARASDTATIQVSQVALKELVAPQSPYEFQILSPDDKGALSSFVTLEGLAADVDAAKGRLGEIQSKIYAVAYLDEAARPRDADIRAQARDRPDDPPWTQLHEVVVGIPAHLLEPYKLRMAERLSVSARVRLRSIGQDAPEK